MAVRAGHTSEMIRTDHAWRAVTGLTWADAREVERQGVTMVKAVPQCVHKQLGGQSPQSSRRLQQGRHWTVCRKATMTCCHHRQNPGQDPRTDENQERYCTATTEGAIRRKWRWQRSGTSGKRTKAHKEEQKGTQEYRGAVRRAIRRASKADQERREAPVQQPP